MQETQEYTQLRFQRRGDRELRRLRKGRIAAEHWEEYSDSIRVEVDIMETWLRHSRSDYEKEAVEMPRQKQLSIALQRRDSKKPRLWQLSTDLSRSGLPGVQFPLGIIKHLLLLCIHVQIFEVHTVVVIRSCTRGHIITHFWPRMYKCCNGPQPVP